MAVHDHARRSDARIILAETNFSPLTARDLVFSANYVDTRTRNPIVTFPAATADIEVGGSSPDTRTAIEAARERVRAAVQAHLAALAPR